MLEHACPEFMAFYFPDACAQIDWAHGHEFQHVELGKVVHDAALGKRFADALVQVVLLNLDSLADRLFSSVSPHEHLIFWLRWSSPIG